MDSQDKWYTDAADYWDKVEATDDGVLGGFGNLSFFDARDSKKFIKEFVEGKYGANNHLISPPQFETHLACDCGAGIGRVSKVFLLDIFEKVDLVEQNPKFLEKAKSSYMGPLENRVDKYICEGLQTFTPEPKRYDVIWCQWVLGHLKNYDLIQFFERCKKGLKDNGMIFVKENNCLNEFDVDDVDSSMTRSDDLFKEIFQRSGLELVKEATQKNFPSSLYPVKMYALKPIKK